jgi:hypothetical protein
MIELDKCTPYQWCLDANIRVLDVNEWPDTFHGSSEKCYFEYIYTKEEFLAALDKVRVKPNSTPRKTDMYLEYRMYGLVPYNISPIQAAIQYGHGVVEYGQNVKGMGKAEEIYDKWANEDKTFIILNGGTTNDNSMHKFYGTLQKHRDLLTDYDVLFSEFREPDLNYSLTAVCFLVDERVFNRDLYPDYEDMPTPWKDKPRSYKPSEEELAAYEVENAKNREKWVEKIGGPKNDFLRTHLRTLRLANN